VVLGGGLLYYTLTHQRPLIPADTDHLQAQTQQRCLECHGPGKAHARGRNHPLNDQCFNCHERR
jgi:nitrate reductase cytochrome c-type subunit